MGLSVDSLTAAKSCMLPVKDASGGVFSLSGNTGRSTYILDTHTYQLSLEGQHTSWTPTHISYHWKVNIHPGHQHTYQLSLEGQHTSLTPTHIGYHWKVNIHPGHPHTSVITGRSTHILGTHTHQLSLEGQHTSRTPTHITVITAKQTTSENKSPGSVVQSPTSTDYKSNTI